MDILQEDKKIFLNGGLKSAFAWSLLTFPVIGTLNYLISVVSFGRISEFSAFLLLTIPNIALIVIYYFALKKGISKFELVTYFLRIEYLAMITIFVMIYNALLSLVITGNFDFFGVGVLPLAVVFIIAKPKKGPSLLEMSLMW